MTSIRAGFLLVCIGALAIGYLLGGGIGFGVAASVMVIVTGVCLILTETT